MDPVEGEGGDAMATRPAGTAFSHALNLPAPDARANWCIVAGRGIFLRIELPSARAGVPPWPTVAIPVASR